MPNRDRNEEGNRSLPQQVLRRLRTAVRALKSPAERNRFLAVVRAGLEEVEVECEACYIHWVDAVDGRWRVRAHEMKAEGVWRTLGEKEGRDLVVEVWEDGEVSYRPDLEHMDRRDEREVLAARLGWSVRSALEVPFEQGVLSLYSSEPFAFVEDKVGIAGEFGDVMAAAFRRLEDLELLQAKEIQLRQMQRLQVMGQLTAEVAHEINNPLSVVVGECSLLLDEKLEPIVLESVRSVYRAGLQAREIAERLLNFVRGQKAEKEWINFNRLVQESVVLVRRLLKNDQIEIIEDLAHNLPWIEAHAGQIQQVMLNLIQNSRDAIRGHARRGMICLRTYVRNGWVVLEVEDNGPGIPEEIREQIFQPFFTTKQSGQGTGLGLSVCEGIARDHGGYLRVEPRSEGACVAMELPVTQTAVLASN